LNILLLRSLKPKKLRQPILCFVGPPGTGKTSLGRSIAEALGRNFVRVSLGGVKDEAEIRGHRRTYIGSMPGRILQTIKRAKPAIPCSCWMKSISWAMIIEVTLRPHLLEVLDPEQNNAFSDHYLEIPYDLIESFVHHNCEY
jgi:ATP-dependent Lon protease